MATAASQASPSPDTTSLDKIEGLLAGIRRRIYIVRLTERLVLALAWGGAVAVCLTGARLLREGAIRADVTHPGLGWCALLLALLPIGLCVWAYRKYLDLKSRPVNGATTLTPNLLLTTLVITLILSITSVALIFLAIGNQVPVWSVPVATIFPFLILAAASVRMIDDRAAAIFVDQQVGLHERVSTALEMIHTPAESAFETAFRAPVITSAIGACQEVRDALRSRATRIGFHRLDQRTYAVAALAAVAAAGITLFTPLPAQAKVRKPQNVVAITQANKLSEVMQELQKATPPGDKNADKHLKPLEQAINELKQGNMSPLEANAALSEAKDQMKKDMQAMEAADKVQQMLRDMEKTKSFAESADELAKSQTAEAQGQQSNTQGSAEQMKDAANELASKMNGGGMSESDKKNLADDLQKAANAAGADPQLQKSLQSAADAARSGDSQKLSQSMQSAGERMGNQRSEQQMAQGSMQRAMDEIDRLQNQSGGQSTMANQGGNQGQSGQQPQGGQNPGGGEQPSGQDGQNGQSGNQGQMASSGGDQQGNSGSGNQGQGSRGGSRQNSGSTMMDAPGGPDGPNGENGPRGGLGKFVKVYDEQFTDTSGSTEKVGSKINPLAGGAKGSVDVKGPADKNDPQFKTYEAVLEDARKRNMEELSRQEIPPQYQEMIKAFYEGTDQK